MSERAGDEFQRMLDEEVRLQAALVNEQVSLEIEAQMVRLFGTPEAPKVFVGLGNSLDRP